jgi:hypothetical protein
MIVRYADGTCGEAVIHKLERGTMRATVVGAEDAVEFTLVGDRWTSEWGDGVTFEFGAPAQTSFLLVSTGTGEATCAAGGDCLLRRMPPASDAARVN